MTLHGRHVLLTGAARGLGAVLARALAAAGARLTLADIAQDEGRALADDLGAGFLPVAKARSASETVRPGLWCANAARPGWARAACITSRNASLWLSGMVSELMSCPPVHPA